MTLSRSQAIVLRELVRAGSSYVPAAQLADALGYPAAVWEERAAHSGTPLACHRAQAVIQRLRVRFGHDLIETAPSWSHPRGGYRLSERGWALLGEGVREVVA